VNVNRVITLLIGFLIPVMLWAVIAWHTTETWLQYATCVALAAMGGGLTGLLAIQWIAQRPVSKVGIAIVITLVVIMPLIVIGWPEPEIGAGKTAFPTVTVDANDITLAFLHSARGPLANGWTTVVLPTVNLFAYNEAELKHQAVPTGAPLAYAAKYQVEWLNVSRSRYHGIQVLGGPYGNKYSLGDSYLSRVLPEDTHLYLKGESTKAPQQIWQFRIKVSDPGQENVPGDDKVRLRLWKAYRSAGPQQSNVVNFGPLPTRIKGVPLNWHCTVEVQPGLVWNESGWNALKTKTPQQIQQLFQTHALRVTYGSAPNDAKSPPTNIYEILSKDVLAQGVLSITIPPEAGDGVVFVSLKIGTEH